MSSWLDTKKYMASLAKTAMAEAQKTLDKALDIDENIELSLENTENNDSSSANAVIDQWGSFSGSFFAVPPKLGTENKNKPPPMSHSQSEPVSLQPRSSTTAVAAQPAPVPSNLLLLQTVEKTVINPESSALMQECSDEEDIILEDVRQATPSQGMPSQVTPRQATPRQATMSTPELPESDVGSKIEDIEVVANNSEIEVETKDKDRTSSDQEFEGSMSSSRTTEESTNTLETKSCNVTLTDLDEADQLQYEDQIQDRENQNQEVDYEQDQEQEPEPTSLEDAMKESVSTYASSSSKSYEMLKLESLPTSGEHSSGDDVSIEVITNTSSDIEIISSPVLSENGRRVQQQNQQLLQSRMVNASPRKDHPRHHVKKGHFRTGSEVSTCPSEDSFVAPSLETDKLLKKLAEMAEILEARETKLVELSRSNLELQEKSTDLTSQVREAKKINSKLNEANISSEEFTQRLSTMEKKLQQTIAERDKFKEESKILKIELASKLPDSDIAEKDEIITDLRAEGESLSKKLGKHSEAIKKLRSKEKSSDKEIKNLREKLEDKTKECDRFSKNLEAKNEVESKQIEAIQNLTTANTKWEGASSEMSSDLEDANEKVNGLKLSLEGAYKEMEQLRKSLSEKEDLAQEEALIKETQARQALQEQLREQQDQHREETDRLLRQIDELREALSGNERSAIRIEERVRRERDDLMTKLQESESRHEELSGSLSSSTRPLLRQIESLQASLSEAQTNSDRVEKSLSDRLQQATVQLAAAQERERNASEQYRQLSSKTATLESKISSNNKIKSNVEAQLEQNTKHLENLKEELEKNKVLNETVKSTLGKEISELKNETETSRIGFEVTKQDLESEKRKNIGLLEQLKDRDRKLKEVSNDLENSKIFRAKSSSPAFSIASASVSSEQAWPDEVFESRGIGAGYDSMRMLIGGTSGSTSAMLESLQSQLKQKEGENVQLQMELARLDRVKSTLTSELTRLSAEAEKCETLTIEHEELQELYQETEAKYQTMLTMYGEKTEEAEELRLDLLDVKEMYKMQIEDLLRKQKS